MPKLDKVICPRFFMAGIGSVMWLTCLAVIAHSDSWPIPESRTYFSSNHNFRVTVNPVSPQHGTPSVVSVVAVNDSKKKDIWSMELHYVPAFAVISDNGRYVALFDEWGRIGNTDHVVVVYNSTGRKLFKLSLAGFLSEKEIKSITHTVSSIWWSGVFKSPAHRFDLERNHLVLSIATNRAMPGEKEVFQERRIDLSTGKVVR